MMKSFSNWAIGRVLILLLVAQLLAACAQEEEPQPAADNTPVPPTATAEQSPPDPTSEPQPTDEPVTETEPEPDPTAVPFDNLHVPSPDWQDQVIYFVMTDRFFDGDPGNNNQGAGEYDPQDFSKYNGGDLQGIIQKLDYIQELGATALWITPPVSNQWWDPLVEFGGYHGYWAENFLEVDPHVGTLADYQALSDALHGQNMFLIQDIVANHTGNFFTYQDEEGTTRYNPNDPAANVRFNPESVPVTRPSQPPFDHNDVTDPEQREEGIYNWTPAISDFNDNSQILTYQLSDLDDLNTTNPAVREALKQSYAYWIENVGVDGFRVDTVRYVEQDFWHDFEYSEDENAPGMTAVAAATGRDDFFTFGEAFLDAQPLDDGGDRAVAAYIGTAGEPGLDAVLHFPLHWSINRVFVEGQPTNYMTYRLNTFLDTSIYPNPYIIPTFIDNHDVARFLSKGNLDGFKQANMLLMTIPGIPVIYYGSEQAFTETRAAMFAEGWASGGEDHFNTESEMFQFISQLAHMRTANPIFTRGTLTTLADSETGPGVLAYRRDYEGQTALVLFNTSDRPILVTDLDTGLAEGTVLKLLTGIVGRQDLIVGRDGKMTLELPAREGLVFMAGDETVDIGEAQDVAITIDSDLSSELYTADIPLAGTVSEPNAAVKIIINGNLDNAIDSIADENGQFSAVIPISLFPPGETTHIVTAYAPELQVASAPQSFVTEVTSTNSQITVYDLIGDDVGPLHTYTLPTDSTFREQMDILSATASAYGTNLLVEVQMAEISTSWNPRNGFDHVLFHVFVDLPNQEGLVELPRINAAAPEGFEWNLQSFSEGWGNRLYSTQGATTDAWGQAVTPAQLVSIDHATDSVQFLFLSDALGNPETLEGAKVYITTWDWNGVDAAYRPLRPIAGPWAFGGGDGEAGDPLIIDDTAVLEIPTEPTFITVDAAGDDYGPYDPQTASGIYTKPTDGTFGEQMDIRRIVVKPDSENIAVTLEMGEFSNMLNAPNGFDRANLHLFFDVLPESGTAILPFLNGETPAGISWDYLSVVDGWNNTLFTADAAAADNYGTAQTSTPTIAVDTQNNSITLLYPRSALGNLEGFENVKIYITSWDWDDKMQSLRALTPEGGAMAFGGGDGTVDPLILDDAILGLPGVYRSPIPPAPQVKVAINVTVPANTPAGDPLYITGEFNNWDTSDKDYLFLDNGDGTYTLLLDLDEGTILEYRITRGTFVNAEKFDPNDRFANRALEVPTGTAEYSEEITIEGWWDD